MSSHLVYTTSTEQAQQHLTTLQRIDQVAHGSSRRHHAYGLCRACGSVEVHLTGSGVTRMSNGALSGYGCEVCD